MTNAIGWFAGQSFTSADRTPASDDPQTCRMRGDEMGKTRDAATEAVAATDQEIAELRRYGCVEAKSLLAVIDQRDATIATLRQALERYGRHDGDCDARFCVVCLCSIDSDGRHTSLIVPRRRHAAKRQNCTCGLSAALDEKGE